MSPKPAKERKDVRISPELAAWIENLPARYDGSFSEKARYLLEVAKEYHEKEQAMINAPEQTERRKTS
jgi:hypothetical protein